jgi:hypothetical protein
MQTMEDSSLRPLWRLTNMLFKVRNEMLTLRDVRNEATTGDVCENKGDDDKMSSEKPAFYTKIHQLRHNRQKSVGLLGRNCNHCALIGEKWRRPLEPTLSGCEGSAGRALAKNADPLGQHVPTHSQYSGQTLKVSGRTKSVVGQNVPQTKGVSRERRSSCKRDMSLKLKALI